MKLVRLFGLSLFLVITSATFGARAEAPAAGNYVQVDLGKYFNNDAVSWDEDPLDGDADFTMMSFPAEELPETNSQVEWNGIRFLFPPKEDGKLNNVCCFGQTIELPQGIYGKMHLLVTATQLAYTEEFCLTYADGSAEKVSLKVPLFQGTPGFAKKAVLKVSHSHRSTGDVDRRGTANPGGSLYGLEIPLDGTKTLKSLTLPEQIQIHVFAITLERNLEG